MKMELKIYFVKEMYFKEIKLLEILILMSQLKL